MSERAAALATAFENANNELIAAVEACTDEQWRQTCSEEGWSVGVTAHHVASSNQPIAGFAQMIADGQELPRLEWKLRDGASGPAGLSVKANQAAKKVRLWTAHSDDRDFRDEKWTSQDLEMKPGSTQAAAAVAVPEKGFTAFMAEVELTSPTGDAYKLSTQIQVTPDNVK